METGRDEFLGPVAEPVETAVGRSPMCREERKFEAFQTTVSFRKSEDSIRPSAFAHYWY